MCRICFGCGCWFLHSHATSNTYICIKVIKSIQMLENAISLPLSITFNENFRSNPKLKLSTAPLASFDTLTNWIFFLSVCVWVSLFSVPFSAPLLQQLNVLYAVVISIIIITMCFFSLFIRSIENGVIFHFEQMLFHPKCWLNWKKNLTKHMSMDQNYFNVAESIWLCVFFCHFVSWNPRFDVLCSFDTRWKMVRGFWRHKNLLKMTLEQYFQSIRR